MRREETGKPVEHEVQLQNDDRIKLIIKRKPFSGFDPHKTNKLSELKEAPLSVSVGTPQGKRMQDIVAENSTTKNGSLENHCQENAKLCSPNLKRKFESVDKEGQPQKKFCNGISYILKPKVSVNKTRSNADKFNIRPCRKYSVCKQSPEECFLGSAVECPRMPLSESSRVDAMPIRLLTRVGHDLSYGCTNVDNVSKCTFAVDRLQSAGEKEITPWDNFSTKVKPIPVRRLKKEWEINNSDLLTKVDNAGNQLNLKVLPVVLPQPQTVQATALTLCQQKSTKSTTPLPQRQATLSTYTTLCQRQSTASKPFEAGTSKPVSSRGQRQPTLATARDRGVQVEPRLLGPCEPGTHIRLDSTILALDEKGHLVISASWRGKTLSGFLMEVKPDSGWGSQHERVPEPQPSGGRLDRKCKRNVTYTVKHKRRRARKVALQEQGALIEELDQCQETERDNEQWQQLTSEEYVTCPVPGCFKKYVNETALRYHLTSGHQQKGDNLKSCRTVFKKEEMTESDCGQLPTDNVTHISKFKKRVLEEEENGRRTSQEAQISKCVIPISNSLSSSRKDCVKIMEPTSMDTVPELSMSLGVSPRFCAPMDAVPNVSTFKDAFSPRFEFTKIKPKCSTSADSVPGFSTSVDTMPKFSPADELQLSAHSEKHSSFTERHGSNSSSPALHPTHNILASWTVTDSPSLGCSSRLELHPITNTPVSGEPSDQTTSFADANSSSHKLHPLTIVATSCDDRPFRSPAQSVSRCPAVSAGDTCLQLDKTTFTSTSACADVNRGYLYSQLDDTDSTSVANVFASSLVGDLAMLSFGDEYKSLEVGGSILGPEVNDLLISDETDNQLAAVDCCMFSDDASRGGSASYVPVVNVELSSHYDSQKSFVCNEKTDLAENLQFLLGENQSVSVDTTEFPTVSVDMIDTAENSHLSLLHENLRVFVDAGEKVELNSQLLPPSMKLTVPASKVHVAENSLVLSVNEHLQTSLGENLTDKIELAENLPFPTGLEYRTCVLDTFHFPVNSQALSASENLRASSVNENLQDSSILENLQFSTMENLPCSSVSENLQVATLGNNLQASSLSETLHVSCSAENFSAIFDKYLFASAGITRTEEEACTLSEKASVGGDLNTNSPICFGAEVPLTTNEAHLVNIHSFVTQNDPTLTLAICDVKETKSKESENANAENEDVTNSRGGYSVLCYEPVSPASSGAKSPNYQDFSVDLYSNRATSSSEFSSTEAAVDEVPVGISQVTVPLSSPTRGSEPPTCGSVPPTNAVHSSKIVYDLSDISDPEDEAPTSPHFDPNCQPVPWFQLGKNSYSLPMFPSVLPSDTNYSYANFCGPPYNYSSSSASVAVPCFESMHGGNFSDASVSQIGRTSELSQGLGSTKTMLENLSQSLPVSHGCDLGGRICSTPCTFVQDATSECRSQNLAASSLPGVDISDTVSRSSVCNISATGTAVTVEGTQNFQSTFEDIVSPVRQPGAWSNMFYANKHLSQRPFNQQYVVNSRDDYSGLQGYNSASIVCDKYSEHAGSTDSISGSMRRPESMNFASLPESVNSVLYTPNVSGLDSFLETLDDLQGLSAENYSCNTQRETTSDQLTFEIASSTEAK